MYAYKHACIHTYIHTYRSNIHTSFAIQSRPCSVICTQLFKGDTYTSMKLLSSLR